MKTAHPKIKYFAVYTLLFAVTALVVFLPFLRNGKSFIWIGQEQDGLYQHYTALVYFGRWGRQVLHNLFVEHSLAVPLWDFSIGYGSDILTTLHYYVIGDPLTLLGVAVSEQHTELLYDGLILFRLYLAGLAFSAYFVGKGKDKLAVLTGALSYVFCGYCLFAAVRHPYFVNPMIYFPLLARGADKIMQKKSPLLFIGMVFVSAVSNFYFYYMLVLAVVFYVAVCFCAQTHRSIAKDFAAWLVKFVLCGILGTAMAAGLLVPVLLLLTGGSRSAIELMHPLLYHYSYYESFLASFVTGGSSGYWSTLGFTAPAVLAVLVLFGGQGRKPLKVSFVLLTALFLFPAAGSVLNGFSYVTNRWCWLYSALMSLILVEGWEDFKQPNVRQRRLMALGSGVYFLVLLTLSFGAERNTLAGCCLMAFAVLWILHAPQLQEQLELRRELLPIGLLAFVLCGIAVNAGYQYSEYKGNYSAQFLDAGKAYETVTQNTASALDGLTSGDSGFFRYELTDRTEKNTGVLTGQHGTDYYWSLANGAITQFQREMGRNSWQLQNFSGTDRRTFLEALASVKYLLSPVSYAKEVSEAGEDGIWVPFGFRERERVNLRQEEADELERQYAKELHTDRLTDEQRAVLSDCIERRAVYENTAALPFGYTCDSYLTREQYDIMTPAQRQEVLLQGVLVEDADAVSEVLTPCKPQHSGIALPYDITCGEGVERLTNGAFYVRDAEATAELTFAGVSHCELYVQALGMQAEAVSLWEQYDDTDPMQTPKTVYNAMSKAEQRQLLRSMRNTYPWKDSQFSLKFEANGSQNVLDYSTPYYQWTTGQEDYLVNLGYSDGERKTIRITFPQAGIYSFDHLQIIAQPMSRYASDIERLTREVLTDVTFGTNTVRGNISLEKDKLLCLSIPYDCGWTATVDGQPAELLQADTMYMALLLPAGTHTVQLHYRTYGLTAGLAVSGIGFAVFAVLAAVTWKKRKRTEKNR